MNIRNLLDDLSSKLSVLERKVQLENKTADYSLNIHLENLYIKILNIVFDYNLVNVNEIKTNYTGIDAIDTINKVAIQFTSTFSKKKIETTINKIISNNLTDDFDTLQFFFLTPKKELTQASKVNLIDKVKGNFQFDIEKGLLDGTSIFQELHYQNNVQKIVEVIKIADDFIELNTEKRFDSISKVVVMFDEKYIGKSYLIVDIFLKNLINVYIASESLYRKFIQKKHKLLEYLVLVNKRDKLNHIEHSVVILSNSFIKNNLETDKKKCILLEKTIENNNQVFIASFDPLLEINRISKENKEFKTFQTLPTKRKNLEQFINEKIIKQIINKQTDESYTTKDIITELKTNHQDFNSKELTIDENTHFNCLKFGMEGFQNLELFYLIINKNYNLKQIQSNFKKLEKRYSINRNNLIVLVPKNFKQKTRIRLELVKKSFNNSEKVYFIDEYLFDKRFKTYPKQDNLTITDFVDPIIKSGNDTKGINDIMHWIMDVSNSPISIISASGGVGKTTLCNKIHDKIISDYERCIVIFIDPENFLEMIKKVQLDDTYNIYSLYKACSVNSDFINDEQTFLLNYKLGNIVMIFDGIDETISTVQNFTLEKFIDKLMSLEQKIGKGKIIINCRDNYIEDFKQLYTDSDQIQFYKLLPFNKSLAKEFFKKNFIDKPKKVKECLELLDEFVLSNELDEDEFLYPPFVLEIIKQVVDKEFDYHTNDLSFNSNFLVERDIIDYIFYKTCNREIAKKDGQGFVLDVDNQVEFMIKLAIEEKGQIKKDEIQRLLIENDRSKDFAKGIVDHPFLLNINAHYEFRFSFLLNHFKTIQLFKLLKDESTKSISDFDIRIFAHEFNYNSLIFKGVINKIKKDIKRDYFKQIKSLIEILLSKEVESDISELTKKAISNLFLLVLELAKLFQFDKTINLIQLIFGNKKQEIENFYLYNVPNEMNLILDFKGLYMSNSQIINYNNFFKCSFNEDTFFEDTCSVDSVYNTNINFKNISATKNNFDKNINGDNSITKMLLLKRKPDKLILDSLKAFFKCFYDGKNLKYNKSFKEVESYYKQRVKLTILIEELVKSELISLIENGDVIKIDKVYHRKINKFIFEGLNFATLNDAILGIINRQKN